MNWKTIGLLALTVGAGGSCATVPTEDFGQVLDRAAAEHCNLKRGMRIAEPQSPEWYRCEADFMGGVSWAFDERNR